MAEEEKEKKEAKPFIRRGEDFEALYANSAYFQPSEWDLKILFGELDSDQDGTLFVEQHTSMAVPWLQAKLMHYYLGLQLGVYELDHGKIPIPASVTPPDSVLPDAEKDNQASVRVYELIRQKREEFLS